MRIKNVSLDDIRPYPDNPRINDRAVDQVAKSIDKFGFRVPIVVDADMVIICGHTRYKAARKLKLDTVPVTIAADLSEDQVRAYRLADNRVGELAKWDDALLSQEIEKILDIDMSEFFDLADLPDDGGAIDLDEDRAETKEKLCRCPKCGFEFKG